MLLSTIFDQLTYGELAGISFGDDDSHYISVDDYPKVVTNINLALGKLYERFPISESSIILQGYDTIKSYTLTLDYAESNAVSTQPIKYILDAAAPFTEDISVITRIYSVDSSDDTIEYIFNERANNNSMYTPIPTLLNIPQPSSTIKYIIEYRAKPIPIDYLGLVDPSSVSIILPEQYLEALCAFTASKIYAALGNAAGQSEASTYYSIYEASCARVEQYGTDQRDMSNNMSFSSNGWV